MHWPSGVSTRPLHRVLFRQPYKMLVVCVGRGWGVSDKEYTVEILLVTSTTETDKDSGNLVDINFDPVQNERFFK